MSTRTKFCRITGPDMSSNALEYRLRVSSRTQRGICFSPLLITSPANSPCQTVVPLVHCLLYTSAAASVASCGHHSTLKKMLEDCTILVQSKSFRCNTSELPRMCCKQRTCATPKSLRCNTYKKPGGGASLRLPPLHPLACHRKMVPEE